MKNKRKNDRAWLLATGRMVAEKLKSLAKETRLRVRMPAGAGSTNTDGWSTVIGNLGKQQPRLEIWYDRFAGYSQRKLYACFRTEKRSQIISITRRVGRRLWPVRTITPKDTEEEKHLVLSEKLARSEFNTPVLEKYRGGRTFYGIYDPTKESRQRFSPHFCLRAVAFFEDVIRSLPNTKKEDEQREVYPQHEKRSLLPPIFSVKGVSFWQLNVKSGINTGVRPVGLSLKTPTANLVKPLPRLII